MSSVTTSYVPLRRRSEGFLRSADFCARFGGEEFVVVLPDTGVEIALEIGEGIRAGIAQSPLSIEPAVSVTGSIGVATIDAGMTISDLVTAADSAVYLSKNNGRNQVRSGLEITIA